MRLGATPWLLLGFLTVSVVAWLATEPVLALAAVLTFGVLGLLAWHTFGGAFYRPPEHFAGVIYRRGRLHTLVRDDEWVILIPWFDQLMPPIKLTPRSVTFSSKALLSRDGVPLHCRIHAIYRPNPFMFPKKERSFWIKGREKLWDETVKRCLMEATEEQVNNRTFDELRNYRREVCREIESAIIADLTESGLTGLDVLRVVLEPVMAVPEVHQAFAYHYVSRQESRALQRWFRLLREEGLSPAEAAQVALLIVRKNVSFSVRWFAGNFGKTPEPNGYGNHKNQQNAVKLR